jgi:hypothetical protein
MPDQNLLDSFARVGLSDDQQIRLNLFLVFGDTLSFTDSTAYFVTGTALETSVSDQFTLSDSIGTFGNWFAIQGELLSLTDILGIGNGNSIGDNYSLTDIVAYSLGIPSATRVPFPHLYRALQGVS